MWLRVAGKFHDATGSHMPANHHAGAGGRNGVAAFREKWSHDVAVDKTDRK